MEEGIYCYFLTEDGSLLHPDIINTLLEHTKKYGEIADVGTGSAYNMPIYLLGELEEHRAGAIVFAWDWDEDGSPHPRTFFTDEEIGALMEALEEAHEKNPDANAWDIAVEVNKKNREQGM